MKFVFEFAEHEEHGTNGWKPQWMPNGDPLSGMGVAHDIMEHERKTDGSVAEELRALGACLWVRGEGGYWAAGVSSHTRWCDNIFVEVADMLSKHVWDDHDWIRPHYGNEGRRLEEHYEREIETAIRNTTRHILYEGNDGKKLYREAWTDPYKRAARRLFREGFRKARRLYRDRSGCDLTYDFQHIEKEADKLLKYAEFGQLLVVNYSRRRGVTGITLKEPCYEDE